MFGIREHTLVLVEEEAERHSMMFRLGVVMAPSLEFRLRWSAETVYRAWFSDIERESSLEIGK